MTTVDRAFWREEAQTEYSFLAAPSREKLDWSSCPIERFRVEAIEAANRQAYNQLDKADHNRP